MLCDYEDEFGQISWRFVSHSFRVFNQLQKRFDGENCNSLSNAEKKQELQVFSKSFREVLLDKLAGDFKFVINSLEKGGLSKDKVDDLDRFLDKVYSVEQFWHLCEFYLLGSSDDLLTEVISWLKVLMTEYNVEQHVVHFSALVQEEIERGSNSGDVASVLAENNFWEVCFGLALHGQLGDIWTLLCIHPDIEALRTLATSKGQPSRVSAHVVATARRLYDELQSIFTSFPFNVCNIVASGSIAVSDPEEQDNAQGPEHAVYKTKLAYHSMGPWKQRVVEMRRELLTDGDAAGALSLLPGSGKELVEDLLGILAGDITVLKGHCESWVELSMCLVLFVHNAPANALTFNSFSLLVDEAMALLRSQEAGNPSEQRSRAMIRQVLRADVGAVVQYILNASNGSPVLTSGSGAEPTELGSHFQITSVLGLLCATHLSSLFHLHGNILGLPQGGTGASATPDNGNFLTQLVLELAEKLNADDYPTEVVMGYLAVCPREQAHPFLVTFLTQRGHSMASSNVSDAAIAEVTALLRSPNVRAFEEARLVERSRGTWWYKARGNRAKAVQYFVRGGDSAAIVHIAGECMQQCAALVLKSFSGDAGGAGLTLSMPTTQHATGAAAVAMLPLQAREELQCLLAEVQEVVRGLQIDDVPGVLQQAAPHGQHLLNSALCLREYSLGAYGLLHLFAGDPLERQALARDPEWALMFADTAGTFFHLLRLQVIPEQ
jgi:hypothetical protein